MDGPYREPKPLSEVIPPDRRRARTAALVLGSMIAGAALLQLAHWALEERESTATTQGVEVVAATVGPSAPAVGGQEPPSITLTADEVQRVVAAHRAAVKEVCWEKENAPSRVASAKVTLNLIVGAKGNVVSASATGTDALVASCVEAQARSWLFPAHAERSASVQIPFVFTRS